MARRAREVDRRDDMQESTWRRSASVIMEVKSAIFGRDANCGAVCRCLRGMALRRC
jgi:hypothetical protein